MITYKIDQKSIEELVRAKSDTVMSLKIFKWFLFYRYQAIIFAALYVISWIAIDGWELLFILIGIIVLNLSNLIQNGTPAGMVVKSLAKMIPANQYLFREVKIDPTSEGLVVCDEFVESVYSYSGFSDVAMDDLCITLQRSNNDPLVFHREGFENEENFKKLYSALSDKLEETLNGSGAKSKDA